MLLLLRRRRLRRCITRTTNPEPLTTTYGITPALMINGTLVDTRSEFLRIATVEGMDTVWSNLALETASYSISHTTTRRNIPTAAQRGRRCAKVLR